MNDGSEYVSNHDRGAFGKLLAEAKGLGASALRFEVNLYAKDDGEEQRWQLSACYADPADPQGKSYRFEDDVFGRTGEEALRRLVEKLRG